MSQAPEPAAPLPADDAKSEVLQLMQNALAAPPQSGITPFFAYASRFRRLSIWNVRMAHIQRPGACAIATEREWTSVGRQLRPDAIPIIILRPFGPLGFIYEVGDTSPTIDRATFQDPFAVRGVLPASTLECVKHNLAKQKHYAVSIEYQRLGGSIAGSAVSTAPTLWNAGASEQEYPPTFGIRLNDRQALAEAFATLAHELGHIFCGHLGACAAKGGVSSKSGWPDRSDLAKSVREFEAEAVAHLVCTRAGLGLNSDRYLSEYVRQEPPLAFDLDMIVRAAARIERLAGLSYGRVAFS